MYFGLEHPALLPRVIDDFRGCLVLLCKVELPHLGIARLWKYHETQDIAGGTLPETVAVAAKEMCVENLQAICQNVVENMQDGLACGLVDRNSGLLMAVHHVVPYFSPEYLDAIAAATVEMFHGRTVKRVEELLSALRGTLVQDSFEEMFIASTTVFHFMKYIREKEVIAILVTRKGASQGLGWAALRNTLPHFIANLP